MPQTPLEAGALKIQGLTREDLPALSGFTCGDADLDDFLVSDALRYAAHGIAKTYLAVHSSGLAGYVAIMADAVILTSNERRKLKASDAPPLGQDDHPVVPALKIGRLAVSADFKERHSGCGRWLVRFSQAMGLRASRMFGCRLLTVDAYPDAVAFYSRLGFVLNKAGAYRDRERPSMRLDLFGASAADKNQPEQRL